MSLILVFLVDASASRGPGFPGRFLSVCIMDPSVPTGFLFPWKNPDVLVGLSICSVSEYPFWILVSLEDTNFPTGSNVFGELRCSW